MFIIILSNGGSYSVTDPANHITTLAYSSGNLTSIKDADGSSWTYSYDSSRNLTVLQSPLNTATMDNPKMLKLKSSGEPI